MNKTMLIIIGIACTVVAAAGIMFNPVSAARRNIYDKNPEVRRYAVHSIGKLGDKKSTPEIRKFLNDADLTVRLSAIEALGLLNDSESIPEIRRLLNDKNYLVRYASIKTLAKFEDKESASKIRLLLNDTDPRDTCYMVPCSAADALATLGDKESIPQLKKLFHSVDYNDRVQSAAEEALKTLGVPKEELYTEHESEIQKARKTEAENFKAIEDFYRNKFSDSHFRGGGAFTDGPSNNMRYHIFIPKEIESLYLYSYSESFLNKQSESNDSLRKMIAANLLQLRHGVLFKRPGATVSYDGGTHNIECIDYATPLKYYILDNPDKESILYIKELLKDEDWDIREQAEHILWKFDVTDEEIQKIKEGK